MSTEALAKATSWKEIAEDDGEIEPEIISLDDFDHELVPLALDGADEKDLGLDLESEDYPCVTYQKGGVIIHSDLSGYTKRAIDEALGLA